MKYYFVYHFQIYDARIIVVNYQRELIVNDDKENFTFTKRQTQVVFEMQTAFTSFKSQCYYSYFRILL